MTPEERSSVKTAYLKLLSIIIQARIDEPLGKTGLTHIKKETIESINDLKMNTSLEVLLRDGIIKNINDNHTLYIEEVLDGNNFIVVDCLKTAEEMSIYKDSLIIENGWSSVILKPFNTPAGIDFYLIKRRTMGGKEEELSLAEGSFLSHLLTDNNIKKTRETIARELGITKTQISNLKNEIRRKLKKIGFSKKETEEMIPRYSR